MENKGQTQQQLQNAASIFEQEKQTIQNALNAIRENENLKKTIIDLRSEFSAKIREANEQTNLGNAKIQELFGDATELARELNMAIQQRNNQGQV